MTTQPAVALNTPLRPTTLLEAFANTAEALQQFGIERVRIVGLSHGCTADEVSEQPSTVGVDGVRVITEQEFMREFMFLSRPCIIVGAIDAWPAMERWRSDTYLFDLDHHLPMYEERAAEQSSEIDIIAASKDDGENRATRSEAEDGLKPRQVTVALTPNGRADAVTYVLYDREDVPEERRDEICNGTVNAPICKLADHPLRYSNRQQYHSLAQGSGDSASDKNTPPRNTLCMEKIFMYAAEVKVTLPELYQLLAESPNTPGARPSYIDMRRYKASKHTSLCGYTTDGGVTCTNTIVTKAPEKDVGNEVSDSHAHSTNLCAPLTAMTASLQLTSSSARLDANGNTRARDETIVDDQCSSGAVPVVVYAQMQNNCLNTEYTHLHDDLVGNVEAFGKRVFGGAPEASNVWFGIPASVSSMHQDWVENLYSVIRGVKEFVLIPPWEGMIVPKPEIPAAAFALDETRSNTLTREFYFKPYPDKDDTVVPWMDLDFEGSLLLQEDGEAKVQALLETATQLSCAPSSKSGPPRAQLKDTTQHATLRNRLHPLVAYVHPGETLYLPAMWLHRVAQHADATDVRARALHRSLSHACSSGTESRAANDASTGTVLHEGNACVQVAAAQSPLPLIAAVNYWYDMNFANPAVVMLREFGLLL